MTDTREKLIELLKDDYCPLLWMQGDVGNLADYLAANGVTVQQWIPVSEGLPVLHVDDYEEPDGSRVQFEVSDDHWVVTASGYQTKARYETGVVFQGWVGEHGETVRNVTHWMSLPEPPKEDK